MFTAAIFAFSLTPFSFAGEKPAQGSIAGINTQEATITINLGSKDGLAIGMPAFILRQAQKLGPFAVISVDKKTAAIQLSPEEITAIDKTDKVQVDILPWLFARGISEYQAKNFAAAIPEFQKVSKEIFGHEPSYFNLGLCYAREEKYALAQKAFQNAAKYNPYNLFTQKFLADVSLLLKKDSDAEKKLKEIIERDMQNTDAHLKSGLLALKKII